jgi:hypothetical protein
VKEFVEAMSKEEYTPPPTNRESYTPPTGASAVGAVGQTFAAVAPRPPAAISYLCAGKLSFNVSVLMKQTVERPTRSDRRSRSGVESVDIV